MLAVICSILIGANPAITDEEPFPVLEQLEGVDATREDYLRYRLKVPGTKITAGQAEALIDAPLEDVMQVLRQYESYKDFLPFFTYSKLLQERDGVAELRLKAKILGGTVEIDTFVEAYEARLKDGGNAITLKFIRGNIERFDARFRAYAVDAKRTFVVFYLMIDPDLWFARNATLSEYNWVNCGRTVRALRTRVLGKSEMTQ